MKRLIFIVLSLFVLFNCSKNIVAKGENEENGEQEIKIDFDSQQERGPSHVLIDDNYYDKTGNIFLINEDYARSYSELVEYNVKTKKIIKNIVSYDDEETQIKEFDIKNGIIVWSLFSSDKGKHNRIYTYNMESGDLNEIINTETMEGADFYTPLSLKTNGQEVSYIVNDIKKNKSKVVIYNLKNKNKTIVDEQKFYEDRYKSRMFFTEISEDKLFYDLRDGEKLYLIVWDLKGKKVLEKLECEQGTLLHFNGSYNKESNYLALYGKGQKEEYIYAFNLQNKKTQKLSGFYEKSYIYNDRLIAGKEYIRYIVQINVTGEIAEHYRVENYDLKKFRISNAISYFDIFETEKNLALLKFDKGIEVIKLEIYKK